MGCAALDSQLVTENNYVRRYELDWSGDDPVTRLTWTPMSLVLRNCTHDGCDDGDVA